MSYGGILQSPDEWKDRIRLAKQIIRGIDRNMRQIKGVESLADRQEIYNWPIDGDVTGYCGASMLALLAEANSLIAADPLTAEGYTYQTIIEPGRPEILQNLLFEMAGNPYSAINMTLRNVDGFTVDAIPTAAGSGDAWKFGYDDVDGTPDLEIKAVQNGNSGEDYPELTKNSASQFQTDQVLTDSRIQPYGNFKTAALWTPGAGWTVPETGYLVGAACSNGCVSVNTLIPANVWYWLVVKVDSIAEYPASFKVERINGVTATNLSFDNGAGPTTTIDGTGLWTTIDHNVSGPSPDTEAYINFQGSAFTGVISAMGIVFLDDGTAKLESFTLTRRRVYYT